jgi:integrase
MIKTKNGLPKHCYWQEDRHGTRRVRFRRSGVSLYLTGTPWSEDFMRQYAIVLDRSQAPSGNGSSRLDSIDAAGLPAHCSLHGLRKGGARRLAEAGASAKEIMSITGHKTLAEVQRYVDAADKEQLAMQAIAKLKRRKIR